MLCCTLLTVNDFNKSQKSENWKKYKKLDKYFNMCILQAEIMKKNDFSW